MNIGESPKLIKIKNEIKFIETESLESIDNIELAKHIKEPAFVYWQSAELIDFGFFDGNTITLNANMPNFSLLQELRIFNRDFELHVWKELNKYRFRIIKDEEKIECEDESRKNCLSQKVKLWGTKVKKSNQFIVLSEDRGMKLSIPIAYQSSFDKDKGSAINIFLKEHKYIKDDEKGCISFYDRRFCGIYVEKYGKLERIEVNMNVKSN